MGVSNDRSIDKKLHSWCGMRKCLSYKASFKTTMRTAAKAPEEYVFIAAPPAAAVVEALALALPEPVAEVREAEAELDMDELATAREEALRLPH